MATSSHRSTIATDLNQTQTVTNSGNVAVDINIRSDDSTDWLLAGTPGADQYTHMFCHTSCTTPPANFTALTDTNATFQEDVPPTTLNTRSLDLRLSTPTSTIEFGTQSMTVTLQASAAS